ncbi:hypothetical protein RV18_GL000668 [Enterococcus termitis]|nr:hypothetical protein RV18_GL000668 [Enterococcus termitis]
MEMIYQTLVKVLINLIVTGRQSIYQMITSPFEEILRGKSDPKVIIEVAQKKEKL